MSFFTKIKGVRVPHKKNTAEAEPKVLPAVSSVFLPMNMHIGAPSVPCVAAGDAVLVGQKVAEAGGFVSSPVHSPVSGTVTAVHDKLYATGEKVGVIEIASDGRNTPSPDIKPPVIESTEDFIAAVRNSGAVGLGGAGFPTAVKLTVRPEQTVDYIIINAAECEPYITSDTRTIIESAEDIFFGLSLLKKYINPGELIIGIEANKKTAADYLLRQSELHTNKELGVKIAILPSVYPQGGEKVLIYNTTHRIVPEGKLPLDVGCIVLNVTTLAVIAKYVKTGVPLTHKVVTVDGTAVKSPANVLAPIGAKISDLLELCGADPDAAAKILYGGPMMGTAVPSADVPVRKNTNAVLAFTEKEAVLPEEQPCIRCGRCVASCPLKLQTVEIHNAYLNNKPEFIEQYKANICMECGCCSYVCPAKRQLTQYMKLAKAALREYQDKQAAAAEKAKLLEEAANGE
ncbi:MAG: electron transport complex subunit RsxC [Oscillospiraceae bacterium]|nr:electron transport complex subunit RsxC [Oscillospiraceae bacterium]